MKNILVATDFSNDAYCALFYITRLMASRPCSFFILNVFEELTAASLTMATIRVMHINEEEILDKEQECNKRLLELCFKDVDHSFHWMQNFADKAQVIDNFLEKLAIDMFAMVHHKRSFIEKFIREPIIKDVSLYSNIPFLILPSQD